MKFKPKKEYSQAGLITGYVIMFLVFATILYFIFVITDKAEMTILNYILIFIFVLILIGISYLLKHLFET
ncbi:MAG: hypothetical protein ABIH37_02265 [archaeon]